MPREKEKAASLQLPLLPYLCQPSAILGLVLVGELLALVIVLIEAGSGISWSQFGAVSMVVQWIVLGSALVLCQLRGVLNRLAPLPSGCLAYGLCLVISAIVLWLAQLATFQPFDSWLWFKYMLVAAIFSGILLRYLYLQQQLSNQQQVELQTRLQSLQARIRPHFLFNSMNTIASLIAIDPPAAEKAIENLSQLFRANLQDVDANSLDEELDICRHYIAIEQIRLADRLRVNWQLEDPLPRLTVPPLLLQPLLENAIHHGIQRLSEGGEIVMSVGTQGQRVLIAIENPIPAEAVAHTDHGNQVALKNVQHRLQLYYNQKAKLKIIKDETNHTFRVEIQLPLGE
jgi:two-component system sensor histidine kinase AlgZ